MSLIRRANLMRDVELSEEDLRKINRLRGLETIRAVHYWRARPEWPEAPMPHEFESCYKDEAFDCIPERYSQALIGLGYDQVFKALDGCSADEAGLFGKQDCPAMNLFLRLRRPPKRSARQRKRRMDADVKHFMAEFPRMRMMGSVGYYPQGWRNVARFMLGENKSR